MSTGPLEADLLALFDSATYRTGAPHEAIDRLRTAGPVVRVPEPPIGDWPAGPGYWAVLSHSETKEVLLDAARFSSHLGGTQLRDPARSDDLWPTSTPTPTPWPTTSDRNRATTSCRSCSRPTTRAPG